LEAGNALEEKISHCMMLDYHFCLVGVILGAAELLVFIGAWPDL
jgi:hypothetical protein